MTVQPLLNSILGSPILRRTVFSIFDGMQSLSLNIPNCDSGQNEYQRPCVATTTDHWLATASFPNIEDAGWISNSLFFVNFFSSELCWEKATVAYTMPQQRKKEEIERLRGKREIRPSLFILDLKDGTL